MIVSRQNEKIKLIRRLRRCKETDLALLEGPHLIRAAIEAGIEVEFLLAKPQFVEATDRSQMLASLASKVYTVDPRILDQVSDADSPRGVLAVCRWSQGKISSLPIVERGIYLYIDGVQNPGNLGALVRVAEAFGVTGLALAPGTSQPNHPRALRASAGSLLRTPIAIRVEVHQLRDHLKTISPPWIALQPRGGKALSSCELNSPFVLAVGSEGRGLRQAVADLVDEHLSIEMSDQVESLNATVATAIALYELIGRPSR